MPVDDAKRRDPLAGANIEPSQEIPEILQRRRSTQPGRQTPIRPSERNRRDRQLSVTFSSPDIPDRLRDLAHAWGWLAPDKRKPAVSDVVEALLLPQLHAAEKRITEGSEEIPERP